LAHVWQNFDAFELLCELYEQKWRRRRGGFDAFVNDEGVNIAAQPASAPLVTALAASSEPSSRLAQRERRARSLKHIKIQHGVAHAFN
jgi:hypothetical protein